MAATQANQVFDLVSWTKGRDPDGSIATIAELMNQVNQPFQDGNWTEGNLPTGHRITQRVGLPVTYTRQLNSPVSVSRDQTAQVDEGLAFFETWAEYDRDLVDLWGDRGAFLFQRGLSFIESLIEKWASVFIYGDPSVDPTQCLGLAPRYSTVSTANAASAGNVIDGGGTSSVNTSIWLVTHGPKALQYFFPKGAAGGIIHNLWDDAVVQGTNGIGGTRLAGVQERWQLKCGFALWDWRWVSRLANIDTNNLRNQTGATDLTEGMIDMTYRMPSISTIPSSTGNPTSSVSIPGKQCFYVNRTVMAALHKQMLNKTNNQLTMEDWFGQKVMAFMGIPVRVCDQILNTESQVV